MVRICVSLILLGLSAQAYAQDFSYALNPGDVLEVSVWKEPDLQRQVLVLPDGMVSFPLAGHLQAAGLTPRQVQDALAERLSEFIPDPVITVSVANVNGNQIYVIGEVNRPGAIQAIAPLDVMQALSVAGGLTPFADSGDILILRRQGGDQQAISFDYSEVKDGEDLETNIVLQSGDVVVVPD